MQKSFIINYVKNITMDDLDNFIKKYNIDISSDDKNTVYNHIKEYCDVFFDDPIKYIKMLKNKIDDDVYYNILSLYDSYKNIL